MVKEYFVIIVSRQNSQFEYEEVIAETLNHYPSSEEIIKEVKYYNSFTDVDYARVEKRHKLED
jgi:hypothetical protein